MSIEESQNDPYELKKKELEQFSEAAKKQKRVVTVRSIAVGAMAVITCTALGFKGSNPILVFFQMYLIPIALLWISNMGILSSLDNKREKLVQELEAIEQQKR